MRLALFLVTLSSLVLSAGCVSQQEHMQAKQKIRDLEYKLTVAESTLGKRNESLAEWEQKYAMAGREIGQLKTRIQGHNAELSGIQKNLKGMREKVRAELDAEYKARMSELQQTIPTVEISAYGGLVLESGIFFLPGRHEVQPRGKTILNPLIDKLKSFEFQGYTIEIAGHSDTDPIRHSKGRYADNHILAANRANDVRRYLISRGISAQRTYISAWGSLRPLSPTGPKAKNRRVEIVLHKDGESTTLEASSPR